MAKLFLIIFKISEFHNYFNYLLTFDIFLELKFVGSPIFRCNVSFQANFRKMIFIYRQISLFNHLLGKVNLIKLIIDYFNYQC